MIFISSIYVLLQNYKKNDGIGQTSKQSPAKEYLHQWFLQLLRVPTWRVIEQDQLFAITTLKYDT